MENPWTLVSYSRPKGVINATIIAKITDGTDVGSLPQGIMATAIMNAANLNIAERRDTYFKIRTQQNIVVIDTYRKTAQDKLLRVEEVVLEDGPHPANTYLAAPDATCKGVVHGIAAGTTEEELREHLESEQVRIIFAHQMGRTNSIVVTFEGTRVPRYVLFHRAAMRCYPHQPRSIMCRNCCRIGHRAEVCTKKSNYCNMSSLQHRSPKGNGTRHSAQLRTALPELRRRSRTRRPQVSSKATSRRSGTCWIQRPPKKKK